MNKKIEKINSNSVGVAPQGDPHKTINKPNVNGITLIALIITIIVMLILVGVTVNIAINGGLFTTAKRAVMKTEEAKKEEQRLVAMANAAIQEKEWVYTTEDGENIPIPAGFAPTEIEGENSTKEGVVITDAEGNEFVWIPCTSKEYEKANWDSSWPSYGGYSSKEWQDSQTEVGKDSLEKLENKKDELGLSEEGIGFYVARYEAGVPEDAPFYASKDGDSYVKGNGKNTDKYIPVSKKGVQVWNDISQKNAITVSNNMYYTNSTVDSYLIDSHAWNYICENILKEKAGKDIVNSSKWGNYSDNTTTKYENLDVLYVIFSSSDYYYPKVDTYSRGLIPKDVVAKGRKLLLETGASQDFSAYNIYDMAGNVWEWTTEITSDGTNNEHHIVNLRGASFWQGGSSLDSPVVKGTYGRNEVFKDGTIGFRVVLYL